MEELKDRMIRAEMDIGNLQSEFHRLVTDFKGMRQELHAIQKSLNQIKYFAMGALMIYAGSTTGLIKFVGALAI